ncbi:MAG: outer membrane lipoprotein chaperone LolA [Proteobacteria bacterium]|jgi:outer membrane lipoprotein carrier protein|nr:outer membrane lipoprotein chaperone LolA [Pseudomonadota bacterium]MBT4107566.1 outer membrane lipoprotein chaperone LolA [Pseudomonadota bacterium]MBT4357656.1 outer membrane lipoprotein chaperone LolA [Pseudomonadota bacterium]MBT4988560.1 outer membrane lipoprotein chaperone LolA [Pseudomonadota bacterium]MBT5624399.1 outer membrane lipoprotein chaperone LolA [Pseudomonadota bacterium]
MKINSVLWFFLLFALIVNSPRVIADSDPLDLFFESTETFSADFQQTVLGEDLELLQESIGRFVLQRPGRLLWTYGEPVEQMIVADGDRLWIYDVSLEQVVVRRQDKGLGATPAGLLADVKRPEQSYLVERLGIQQGIYWVSLFPKDSEGPFSQIQLGFDEGVLRFVQMLDQLEQVTRVQFENISVNQDIDAQVFVLDVPGHVDVIREDL